MRDISPLLEDDAVFQWDDVLVERDLFLMDEDNLYGIPLSILPLAMTCDSSTIPLATFPDNMTLSTLRSVLENSQAQTDSDTSL